jgi:hypothetical protein
MIAEIIPGTYDVCGKRIPRPRKQHCFTQRPMGTFFSQPLKIVCRDLDEIRAFLVTCRYVSDRDQFGVLDHYEHTAPKRGAEFHVLAPLVWEWIAFRAVMVAKVFVGLLRLPVRLFRARTR